MEVGIAFPTHITSGRNPAFAVTARRKRGLTRTVTVTADVTVVVIQWV